MFYQLKNDFKGIHIEKFKLDEHHKIEEFINKIYEKLGGLDILVNNAGITLDNLSMNFPKKIGKKF